jgi:hypothetical protein
MHPDPRAALRATARRLLSLAALAQAVGEPRLAAVYVERAAGWIAAAGRGAAREVA